NRINAHSEATAMIGDRMDTDVVAGMEAGLRTYLVLTGSTNADEVEAFPYRPTAVMDGIQDLVELLCVRRRHRRAPLRPPVPPTKPAAPAGSADPTTRTRELTRVARSSARTGAHGSVRGGAEGAGAEGAQPCQ